MKRGGVSGDLSCLEMSRVVSYGEKAGRYPSKSLSNELPGIRVHAVEASTHADPAQKPGRRAHHGEGDIE